MKYPSSDYAKYILSLHSLPPNEQKASVKKLAEFLAKNSDIKDWKKIEDTYKSLREKKSAKKTAVVSYFGDIHKTKIKETLANYEVEFEENNNLKGGISIKIGDLRIDNSIAGRLAEVKKVLN